MRRQIGQYSRPRKQKKRHDDEVASKASDAVRRRQEEGHTGRTDQMAEDKTEQERRNEQLNTLTQRHHLDEDAAHSMVDEAMERDWRVRWISSPQDSDAFFNIDLMAGMLQVIFNTEHPLHSHLMAALENVPEDAGEADLRERLARASEAFKLLIFSWARMEDEIPGDRDRLRVSYARRDWGRYARDFIEGEGEDG
jgi:hypothetical protein